MKRIAKKPGNDRSEELGRCLVIGGSGMLGSAIARELRHENKEAFERTVAWLKEKYSPVR